METTIIYTNLVHGLVSRLANMQEAGIISNFNYTSYLNSREDKTITNYISLYVDFPWSDALKRGSLSLRFDDKEAPYDEEKVIEFSDMLDTLVKERYEKVKDAKEVCSRIEEKFKDLINQ